MKTFLLDIIPKIQKYSQKLDNLTLLTNQHWVVIDNIKSNKTVYIFRKNRELLISQNGKVTKGEWEFLGNNSLLIDHNNDSFLFKHGFFDENILALKIDGINEYSLLVNETKFDGELNSIENISIFLNNLYLKPERKLYSDRIQEFTSKKSLRDLKDNEFKVKREDKGWSYSTGDWIEYFIEFENFKGTILYSSRQNKYSYSTNNAVEYFDNFKECLKYYRKYLTNK